MNRKLYWGTVFCETDLGGWTWAKVRPWPYWFLCRTWLFVRLVWRRHESVRIDWRTAWAVSACAAGLVGPMRVHRLPVVEVAR